MRAVVDHADQKEEHAGDGAVIEHLQHRAIEPLGGEARHAEHHVAHVTYARIRDQFFKILLRHGAKRPVDNVPGAERAE